MKHLTLIPAIHRASHAISGFLDTDPELTVTQAEAHILARLASYGDSTVGQIHVEFGYKRSTLTSILNRLEERRLITCRVSSADRRSLLIGLTPSGKPLARAIHQKLGKLEEEIMSAYSALDLKELLRILAAVKTVTQRV